LGRHFEWRVRDYLKQKGYFVLRSPQSRGPVDLVAIRKGEILFIQCRINGYLEKAEKYELVELAKSVGAKACLAWRGKPPYYPIEIENI
jgi:Holliday junction resolvase